MNAAIKNQYKCMVCQADSVYMCRLCHSCYCCREHLDQDNQACHELICSLKHTIGEIQQLPLAEQNRAQIRQKLKQLQNQCRQICYLQAKKHILNNNLVCALPAAERSLEYAIQVNGLDSVALINPLLALADVSSAAGSKHTALDSINRAQMLIETQFQKVVEMPVFKDQLYRVLRQNIESMQSINQEYCVQQLNSEINHERRRSRLSSRLDLNNSNTFRSSSAGRRSIVDSDAGDSIAIRLMQSSLDSSRGESCRNSSDMLLQQQFNNYSKEEAPRYWNGGSSLAGYQQKLHQSKANVFYRNHDFVEALYEQSVSVYYATLAYGIQSLQFIQQLGYLSTYGAESKEFTDIRVEKIQLVINQLYCRQVAQHFARMLSELDMMRQYYFIEQDDYGNIILQQYIAEFLDQKNVNEELRLGFQGDFKEAMKMIKPANIQGASEDTLVLQICVLLGKKVIGLRDLGAEKKQNIETVRQFLGESSAVRDYSLEYINNEESRVQQLRKLLKQIVLYVFAGDIIQDKLSEQEVQRCSSVTGEREIAQ